MNEINFQNLLSALVLLTLAMAYCLARKSSDPPQGGCHGNPKNLTANGKGGNSQLEPELPPQFREQAERYIRRWMDSRLFRPES